MRLALIDSTPSTRRELAYVASIPRAPAPAPSRGPSGLDAFAPWRRFHAVVITRAGRRVQARGAGVAGFTYPSHAK